ncbi:ABC transporter permease [Sulfitobacter donghicola]|uniref:Histidine transporter permease HisQ n=1 Tax=Sulfitobacter donghicola DSW-25 = KCTC 12864 = JCM 14565 TaxID=1300350 RepID=A0A073IC14_9RHOB|nr:ABC transporter permease subunit [Sulfitobacter donghicola]KEJ87873.1 histidine transporter permease HisQ [Sulfitobacter donghicola DSW-25 = KCTC 12864 = JCM 14565]KIN67280.1 Histidine transport system permease protein HisQ [Sulfitobacter donghicola DSW-25 = KCTC 12864 = JCM 14565]
MDSINSFLGPLAFGSTGWGDDLARGAWITLTLALWSMSLGLIFGLGLAGMKLSRFAPLRWLAAGYTLFIRGVPEFLILLVVFFGSDALINAGLLWMGFEAGVEVPKFAAAVAGLSAIFAAYACEIFRGAYLAVPPGQIEAAEAIGLSRGKIFWRIRCPQMLRFAIPGLGNLWMVVLKDTSLAAVIALDELLRISKLGGETEGRQLTFFVAAGCIYLALTLVSDIGRAWIERRARRGMVKV